MRSRVLSPDQFPVEQHDGVDGPLGSYGEPTAEMYGYEGTGMVSGANPGIPAVAGI